MGVTINRRGRIWHPRTFTTSKEKEPRAAPLPGLVPTTREIESHSAARQLTTASCLAITGRRVQRSTELSPTYDSRCSGDRLSPRLRSTIFTRPFRHPDSTGSFLCRKAVSTSVQTEALSHLK